MTRNWGRTPTRDATIEATQDAAIEAARDAAIEEPHGSGLIDRYGEYTIGIRGGRISIHMVRECDGSTRTGAIDRRRFTRK